MKTHVPLIFREKFNCDQCEFISLSKTRLKNHKKYDHGTVGQKFVCHCGKAFDKPGQLRFHNDYSHRKFSETNRNVCPVCGKLFTVPSAVKV